jgi:two-component system, cell cycle response regulator
MRYRIALCGFSEFEYRAMHFSFLHPTGFSESAYDVVDALSDADFAVVDADSKPAVKGVLQSGRIAQAVFVGAAAPAGAGSHLQRPIDPNRILRTLDALTARRVTPSAPAPTQPGELPTLDDVVVLPQAPIEAAAMMPPVMPGSPSPHSAAKAAARAKARRARLAGDTVSAQQAEPLRDVLVLDADTVSNTLLCALLERFGFQAHAVATQAQVSAQLAARPFAAVFLDMPLDDVGVALLQQIRALPAPWPHAGPAVLLVSARVDPAGRVRAALAGLGEPLVKPLGRGDVARALESRGVTLPADARRH